MAKASPLSDTVVGGNVMKVEELMEEMIEEAKNCKTPEERKKFLSKHHIELSLDQLDKVSGGSDDGGYEEEYAHHPWCPYCGYEGYMKTGKRRPGKYLGIWDDYQYKCANEKCGKLFWKTF